MLPLKITGSLRQVLLERFMMRRIKNTFVWWLVLALSPPLARADDAFVLPSGRFRIYAVSAWTSISAAYGGDGNRLNIPEGAGRSTSFNTGGAIEYGVNHWLTAGFQWTPGITLSSSFDFPQNDPARRNQATINDSFDALAGVKIGILGSSGRDPRFTTGIAQSRRVRIAVGLAVKFPMTSIDWDREAARFSEGRSYLAQAVDKHLVAPVFGFHMDAILMSRKTSEFYVNFYARYIPYLSLSSYKETSLARYLDPALDGVRIDHRYDAYFEIEPRYERWVAPRKLRAGFYVPVRYRVNPAPVIGGIDQHNSGTLMTLFPALNLLSPSLGVPVELRIGYQTTLAGRLSPAPETFVIILRAMP